MSDVKEFDQYGILFSEDNPKLDSDNIFDIHGNPIDEGAVYPSMDPDKESSTFVAGPDGKLLPIYENIGNSDVEGERTRIIGDRKEALRRDADYQYTEQQVDLMEEALEKDLRKLSPQELFKYSPERGSDYEQMHAKICGRLGDITSSEGKRKADEMDMRYPSMASPAAKERTFSRAVGLID